MRVRGAFTDGGFVRHAGEYLGDVIGPGRPALAMMEAAESCELAVLSVTICMQKEDGTPAFI